MTHARATSFFSFLFSKLPPSENAQTISLSLDGSSSFPGAYASSSMQNQPSKPPPNMSAMDPSSSKQAAAASSSSSSSSLHPEIRSVVSLTIAHAHKIYFSGPLIRRIERQSDGHKPTKDDGWTEVWAQLGGTTLSVWDMAEIQEASRQGKEVPPTYVNVTDAVRIPLEICYSQLINYLVCSCPGFRHCTRSGNTVPTAIYKRLYSQYRWFQSPPLLLSVRTCTHLMGFCLETISMGKITFGGNIYCSFDQNYA